MVDVTDGPDVHMRFIALEFGLRHFEMLLLLSGFSALGSASRLLVVRANQIKIQTSVRHC
jgi:hypothetical protein